MRLAQGQLVAIIFGRDLLWLGERVCRILSLQYPGKLGFVSGSDSLWPCLWRLQSASGSKMMIISLFASVFIALCSVSPVDTVFTRLKSTFETEGFALSPRPGPASD